MNKNLYDDYVCPQCRVPLIFQDSGFACGVCSGSFPIVSEIPCFASGSSAWKLSASEPTYKIIENAKKGGWKESLLGMTRDKADWISGTGRYSIAAIASPKKRVLDSGCGWGGVSFWLAKEFEHVYALDIKVDGLEFINVRASQENVNNITAVQASLFSLPFPDSFFDVVVLNGVLEWVGTFSEKYPPLVMQEMAVKEMARVLQPDGTMYVAIENRFGLQYFLGYKEEHTGLRYISLLPRRLAQIYHRNRKGEDFRTLTHSRRGLMKILEKSGFYRAEWFSIFPSYRNCKYAVSLEGTGAFRFLARILLPNNKHSLLNSILISVFCVLTMFAFLMRIMSFFSPSWVVFASREKAPQLTFQNKTDFLPIKDSMDVSIAINIGNRRANIFGVQRVSGELKEKYSVPLNEVARKKVEMSHYAVSLIRKHDPSLSINLPEISIYHTRQSLLEYTKAVPGDILNPGKSGDLTLFFDFLMKLSRISLAEDDIQCVPQVFDVRGTLSRLAETYGLAGEIQDVLNRTGIIHGDLSRDNILVNKTRPRQLLVIDFEHAVIGPAVLNWYDFLLRNFIICGNQLPIRTDVALKRCRKLPGNRNTNPSLTLMTRRLLEACRVPFALHGTLAALYTIYACYPPIASEPEVIINAMKSMDLEIRT